MGANSSQQKIKPNEKSVERKISIEKRKSSQSPILTSDSVLDENGFLQKSTEIEIPSISDFQLNIIPFEMASSPQEIDENLIEATPKIQSAIFKWWETVLPGQKVEICGSWDGWSQKIPLNEYSETDNYVFTTLHLKPGSYEFKYIVDGNWLVDPKGKLTSNTMGTQNNLLVVEENSSETASVSDVPEVPRVEVESETTAFSFEAPPEIQIQDEEISVKSSTEASFEDPSQEVWHETTTDAVFESSLLDSRKSPADLQTADELTDTEAKDSASQDDSGVMEDDESANPVVGEEKNKQKLVQEELEKLPVVNFYAPEKVQNEEHEKNQENDPEGQNLDPGMKADTVEVQSDQDENGVSKNSENENGVVVGKQPVRVTTPPSIKPIMDPNQFDLEFLKNLFVESNGQLLYEDIQAKYQQLTGQKLAMAKLNSVLGTNVKNPAVAFTKHSPKNFTIEFSFTSRLIIKYQPNGQ